MNDRIKGEIILEIFLIMYLNYKNNMFIAGKILEPKTLVVVLVVVAILALFIMLIIFLVLEELMKETSKS